MPEKKTKLMLAGIAVCLLVFLAMQQIPKDTGKEDFTYIEAEPVIAENVEESLSEIVVHVAGAVDNPGVYTLQEGERVEDALQMAGVLPEADIDALNRASVLSDGQKIVVPVKYRQSARRSMSRSWQSVKLRWQAKLRSRMPVVLSKI